MATVSSAVSARVVGRVSPKRLLGLGLRTMTAGTAALLATTVAGVLSVAVCLTLLAVVCTGLGLVVGNAAALAIDRVPTAAGTGSALLGTAQNVLGAVVAPLVGLGGSDTALPLFAGTAMCAAVAAGAGAWAPARRLGAFATRATTLLRLNTRMTRNQSAEGCATHRTVPGSGVRRIFAEDTGTC